MFADICNSWVVILTVLFCFPQCRFTEIHLSTVSSPCRGVCIYQLRNGSVCPLQWNRANSKTATGF